MLKLSDLGEAGGGRYSTLGRMTNSPIEINTIVIGAGPAGLAVGACLKQAGIEFIILEQSDKAGPVWRRHYDRLHLHTDKKNSELPFVPFPKDYPRYPSRDQLVSYLESYSKKFDLHIRFNQQVMAARRANIIIGKYRLRVHVIRHSILSLPLGMHMNQTSLNGKDKIRSKAKLSTALNIKTGSNSKGRVFWW